MLLDLYSYNVYRQASPLHKMYLGLYVPVLIHHETYKDIMWHGRMHGWVDG